jgi:hypothetical protein
VVPFKALTDQQDVGEHRLHVQGKGAAFFFGGEDVLGHDPAEA